MKAMRSSGRGEAHGRGVAAIRQPARKGSLLFSLLLLLLAILFCLLR